MNRETSIVEARAAYDAALKEHCEAWYAALRKASAQWSEDVAQANALPTVDQYCKAMTKALRRYDKTLAAADTAHRGRINETHEALIRPNGRPQGTFDNVKSSPNESKPPAVS